MLHHRISQFVQCFPLSPASRPTSQIILSRRLLKLSPTNFASPLSAELNHVRQKISTLEKDYLKAQKVNTLWEGPHQSLSSQSCSCVISSLQVSFHCTSRRRMTGTLQRFSVAVSRSVVPVWLPFNYYRLRSADCYPYLMLRLVLTDKIETKVSSVRFGWWSVCDRSLDSFQPPSLKSAPRSESDRYALSSNHWCFY